MISKVYVYPPERRNNRLGVDVLPVRTQCERRRLTPVYLEAEESANSLPLRLIMTTRGIASTKQKSSPRAHTSGLARPRPGSALLRTRALLWFQPTSTGCAHSLPPLITTSDSGIISSENSARKGSRRDVRGGRRSPRTTMASGSSIALLQ